MHRCTYVHVCVCMCEGMRRLVMKIGDGVTVQICKYIIFMSLFLLDVFSFIILVPISAAPKQKTQVRLIYLVYHFAS